MYVISGEKDARYATVHWTDKRLAKVTSLCLYASPATSWFDVVYCRGEMLDGTTCWVGLPFAQLSKGLERVTIIRHAKHAGVFAKGLKVLESLVYLTDERSRPNEHRRRAPSHWAASALQPGIAA